MLGLGTEEEAERSHWQVAAGRNLAAAAAAGRNLAAAAAAAAGDVRLRTQVDVEAVFRPRSQAAEDVLHYKVGAQTVACSGLLLHGEPVWSHTVRVDPDLPFFLMPRPRSTFQIERTGYKNEIMIHCLVD